MAVGIGEVDRVADPVVGELDVEAPLGELGPRPLEPLAIDAEGDVEDPRRRRVALIGAAGGSPWRSKIATPVSPAAITTGRSQAS